jgi:hypothetical protein
MDSDFKAPNGEAVKNDSADETKVPVMDDSSPVEKSSDSEGDSHESDNPVVDEHMESDAEDSSTSTEDKPPVVDSTEASETPMEDDKFDSFSSDAPTDSESAVEPLAVVPPVKIRGAHRFIYGYVGLIILVAAVVGVYVWQHDKVSSLNAQVTAISSQLSAQQQEVTSLKSQLAKADSLLPANLGLTIVKTARYTPSTANSVNNSGVAIDIKITNPTSKAVSLVTSDFNLKDSKGNNYVAANYPTQTTDSSLPTGYTLLIDQSLAPNATVTGTLEFSVPTTTLTSFTLVYNSQTVPATVN